MFINLTSFAFSDVKGINSLLDDSKKAFVENRVEEGLTLLDKAAQIAKDEKDAAMCLKIGLEYLGLPREYERKSFASVILKNGAEFALAQQKWQILAEYAEILQELGEKDTAVEIYDNIFLKAGEMRDKDTVIELKKRYTQLGDAERADICQKMIDALTIAPPQDWQPLGESVRGAKQVDTRVQQSQGALADQEVQGAMDYFREKKKQEQQKKNKPVSYNPYDNEPNPPIVY